MASFSAFFFVNNTNFDLKLMQIYQYSKFLNLICIPFDLLIHNKNFLQQEILQLYCQPGSTSCSEALHPLLNIAAILIKICRYNKSLQSHFMKILFSCLEKSQQKHLIFSLLQCCSLNRKQKKMFIFSTISFINVFAIPFHLHIIYALLKL